MDTDITQLQLPDWVNNEFFAECLQEELKNETVSVIDFTPSSVVPPGNNYGSFIFRVKVNYKYESKDSEIKTLSLIIKSELLDPIIKEITAEINKKEPFFYYSFLPKASLVGETDFAPKCFFSPRPTVTILEDLTEKGFLMADRMKQLDFEHCRLYMTAAATFHAVSLAVFKRHPETIDQVNTSPMYSDNTAFHTFFNTFINIGMKFFIEETEKIVSYQKYAGLLKKIVPNLWNMLVAMHKPGEGINTIRQGDPWTTNMMFRYDDRGEPRDIRLIDFQGIQYGSPAPDVVFFIWSSANNDVKKTRLPDLYRTYVDTFNAKLRQYECQERLSFPQFLADVRKASPQALFLAATMYPIFIHPEPVDLAGIFTKGSEETETVLRKYYDRNFRSNHLPSLLECLEVNGAFDYLQHYER